MSNYISNYYAIDVQLKHMHMFNDPINQRGVYQFLHVLQTELCDF